MNIIDRPALAPLTTLGIGGRALAEIRLDAPEDCLRLPEALAAVGGFVRVLGGGSNLLVHDGDLPFTVLRPLFGPRMRNLKFSAKRNPTADACSSARAPACGFRIFSPGARGLAGLEGLVACPAASAEPWP